eukprot:IDg18752t1
MHSIQTPLGVYTPTRMLQGGSDSGNHFQAVSQDKFESRKIKMLQWIDDFLLYAKDETDLLKSITDFLSVCEEYRFKGVQYDPRHFDALLNMKTPTFADELQQLICATNWMRTSLPAYAETIAPLHTLMESIYAKTGKRTKRAVRKIRIDGLWGA